MQESKWPQATAIIAVAAAMTIILTPWDRVGPIDWSAVSAIGTLLAVITALGVPMWQNIGRLREQNEVSVVRSWITAHIAYQILGRIDELLVLWAESIRPSSTEFSALHTRLNNLQDRVDNILGVTITSELASIAGSLEGAARKYENAALISATRANSISSFQMFGHTLSRNDISEYQRKTVQLKRNCEDWMLRVLSDADRKKIDIPGVVRSGLARGSMSLSAKADGKIQNGGDTA